MDIIKVENLSFSYKSGEDDSPDFQALDKLIHHYGSGRNITRMTMQFHESKRENANDALAKYGVS